MQGWIPAFAGMTSTSVATSDASHGRGYAWAMPTPTAPAATPSALLLRTAVATDLSAITALYAQEVRDHVATYEYDEPDEAEMTRRWQAVVAQGYPYLVAERDGRFAGYAYAARTAHARGIDGPSKTRSTCIRTLSARASDARWCSD